MTKVLDTKYLQNSEISPAMANKYKVQISDNVFIISPEKQHLS